ncbi:GNAT family N-acetyltransferase [Chloroflexota bacterium]
MITGGKVRLYPKRLGDAARDYVWQTDPGLTELDASSPLTMKFTQYLLDYAGELGHNGQNRHQFAIDTLDGEHIGNCAYYGINDESGEAEIGVMIGNRGYWDMGYGADTLTALADHIFRETKLERIFLKTLDSNRRAQRCFAKCGFTVCGELINNGYNFLLMELYRHQWQQSRGKNRQGEAGYDKKEYCRYR